MRVGSGQIHSPWGWVAGFVLQAAFSALLVFAVASEHESGSWPKLIACLVLWWGITIAAYVRWRRKRRRL